MDAHRIRRITEGAVAAQVEVFAVGAIEQVVDSRHALQPFAETIACVEREHREAGTAAQVATDHVALVRTDTVL